MFVVVDYATPSALSSTRGQTDLALCADGQRPVRFHARVRQDFVLPVRLALRALGELIWSDNYWYNDLATLDPIVTVHQDRVLFEAFSQDQSAYGLVMIERDVLEPAGTVRTGTTNVDFTAWLWAALGEMRSSRPTWLRIGPEGLEVRTEGRGGRFEPRVELPNSWIRGLLQVQAAAAFPGTRLAVKPVDLLNVIRFLRFAKAKVSPRALRYEMPPGEEARLVVEPFEHVILLRGAAHGREEPYSVRTWGRRRLRLLEPLLPHADQVRVYLKGRAQPSFYVTALPGVTFTLGLTGWTSQGFTDSGGHDLLSGIEEADEGLMAKTLASLEQQEIASVDRLANDVGGSQVDVDRALARLCRRGRTLYDVEQRAYRHRELFATPIDSKREAELFPPDRRSAQARLLLTSGDVQVEGCVAEETKKVRKLSGPMGPVVREIVHRDYRITGSMPGGRHTEIVVGDEGRIVFGTCTCRFFVEHLLHHGPCAHMVALFEASAPQRRDLPTSAPVPPGAKPSPRRPAAGGGRGR